MSGAEYKNAKFDLSPLTCEWIFCEDGNELKSFIWQGDFWITEAVINQ